MQSRILSEIHMICAHALRLLLKKKQTLLIFVLGFLFFFLLLFFLEEAKEEKSVVFIGVLDEDKTELSEKLAERIYHCEVFGVTMAPLDELLAMLAEGKLTAVFVIKKGYANALARGEERRLITMYEAEGKGIPLLADIVAGEIMYDLCTSKGFISYEKVMKQSGREKELLSKEAYAAYVTSFLTKEEFDFSFQAEYLDREGKGGNIPKQTVIYMQVIFAVLSMLLGLLAVYAVIPYADLCHGRAAKRMCVLPFYKASFLVGSGIAAMLPMILFGTAAVILFAWKNELPFFAGLQMFLYTTAYSGGIVIITMLFAKLWKHAAGYQLFMLALVVIFGMAGFLGIAGGLLPQTDWLGFSPNSVYIKAMIRCYSSN